MILNFSRKSCLTLSNGIGLVDIANYNCGDSFYYDNVFLGS